jgi:hypothetical protein
MFWLRWFVWGILVSPAWLAAQDFQDGEYIPQGRYLLRWGLQPGQKFQVEAFQRVVTDTEGPLGSSGPVPASLTILQDWEVIDRNEKTITLLQTFRQLKMEMIYPVVGKIATDTADPAPENTIAKQVHRNLTELVGRSIQIQMDRLGKVSKYQFLEPVAGADAAPNAQFLTADNLKNAVGQMVQFPEYSLAVGDTWATTHPLAQTPGSAEVTTEYRLQSVSSDDPNLLKIQVAPKLQLHGDDQKLEIEEQSSDGFVLYDHAQRMVRETSLTQSLTIRMAGAAPGKRKIETTVRMKIAPTGE